MARKRRSAQKSTGLGRDYNHINNIPTTDLSSGRWSTMLSHMVIHSGLVFFNGLTSVLTMDTVASQPVMSIPDSISQHPTHPNPCPASDDTTFSFPSPFENNHPFEDDTPTSSHAHADVLNTVDKKRKRPESGADSEVQLDTAFNGPPHDQRLDEITQPAVTCRVGITGSTASDGPPPAKVSRKGASVAARFAQDMKDCGFTKEVIQNLAKDLEAPDEANSPNPRKAPKPKKALRAKESSWADIPDWKGREDSPMLSLPLEVLDRCFGLRGDMFVSAQLVSAATTHDEAHVGCKGLGMRGRAYDCELRLATTWRWLGLASSSAIISTMTSSA